MTSQLQIVRSPLGEKHLVKVQYRQGDCVFPTCPTCPANHPQPCNHPSPMAAGVNVCVWRGSKRTIFLLSRSPSLLFIFSLFSLSVSFPEQWSWQQAASQLFLDIEALMLGSLKVLLHFGIWLAGKLFPCNHKCKQGQKLLLPACNSK